MSFLVLRAYLMLIYFDLYLARSNFAVLYNKVRNALNSEFLVSTYGVLRLKLDPALYEWQFMDMNGNVLDRGLNVCH